MELKNVKITKIGNKNKPSAYLPIKRKVFVENGLSFDKAYDVNITFTEVVQDEQTQKQDEHETV